MVKEHNHNVFKNSLPAQISDKPSIKYDCTFRHHRRCCGGSLKGVCDVYLPENEVWLHIPLYKIVFKKMKKKRIQTDHWHKRSMARADAESKFIVTASMSTITTTSISGTIRKYNSESSVCDMIHLTHMMAHNVTRIGLSD